jgi:nicotinamidase-related amidase
MCCRGRLAFAVALTPARRGDLKLLPGFMTRDSQVGDGVRFHTSSFHNEHLSTEPTAMRTKNYTKERFSANDAALVLIDHQSEIMQPVRDYSPAEFPNNVIGLAKLGKVFKLPTVLSTSLGQGPNGPFIPEVVSMFPDVPVIDRPGIIDAWDDPKFVAAIEKTGRKNLIMAGVTVDVCLAFAAIEAIEAGYNVYGVIDASGALEVTIRENAVARMKDYGVTPINWTTVAAELQRDWRLATGKDLGRVFHDHYQSYGLLMDSFEYTSAQAARKAS